MAKFEGLVNALAGVALYAIGVPLALLGLAMLLSMCS